MKVDISVQTKLLPRMIEVHGGSFLHAALEVWFESGTPRYIVYQDSEKLLTGIHKYRQ